MRWIAAASSSTPALSILQAVLSRASRRSSIDRPWLSLFQAEACRMHASTSELALVVALVSFCVRPFRVCVRAFGNVYASAAKERSPAFSVEYEFSHSLPFASPPTAPRRHLSSIQLCSIMSVALETPSKAAAVALAQLDVKGDLTPAKSLLSKMQATMDSDSDAAKVDNRVHAQITMESGKKIQHASTAPRGKFVGDLSITDDSQEPLLQETEQRFVLFPIKYHEVGTRFLHMACLRSLGQVAGRWPSDEGTCVDSVA